MMHAADGTRTTKPILLLLLAGVTGCNSPPLPTWSFWPFAPPERVRYETPAERIDRLETLGEQAAKADKPQQQQLTAELARHIQTENDPLVREHIIRAIARSSDPKATAVLRAGLRDEHPDVRVACCDGLVNRRDDQTLSALAEVLRSDTDLDVRQAATRCLAHFRGPGAVSALAVALQDRDPALQYLAVQSLRQMTDADYGNDVNAWLEFARGGHPRPKPPTLAERVRRMVPF